MRMVYMGLLQRPSYTAMQLDSILIDLAVLPCISTLMRYFVANCLQPNPRPKLYLSLGVDSKAKFKGTY